METRVTVRIDSVTVGIQCPHEMVDNETIEDVARSAIRQGLNIRVVPYGDGALGDPEFGCFVEAMDIEIEDDGRHKNAPKEFDTTLKWWLDCTGGGSVHPVA